MHMVKNPCLAGIHMLPDARFFMDSTLMRCATCDVVFVVCSIMGQDAHAKHWMLYRPSTKD